MGEEAVHQSSNHDKISGMRWEAGLAIKGGIILGKVGMFMILEAMNSVFPHKHLPQVLGEHCLYFCMNMV